MLGGNNDLLLFAVLRSGFSTLIKPVCRFFQAKNLFSLVDSMTITGYIIRFKIRENKLSIGGRNL